jgi:glycosyltransferase involved in cell wall biosynthesis
MRIIIGRDRHLGEGSGVRGQAEVPAASIIIPTLNEEKHLPVLLESLRNAAAPMEIIVVDGSSTDRTAEVVHQYKHFFSGDASLQLLHSSERSIAIQRNMGAAVATHDLLIFCDADVLVPSRDTYVKLLSLFCAEHLVVASPVTVPIEPGLRFKLTFKLVYCLQRLVLWTGRPYFGGAYLMTTKQTFLTLGGFNVDLALAEDVDYSLRAAKLGPYRLIDTAIAVSARRLIKYGYAWAIKALPTIVRFIRTGFIAPGSIHYPFGEYDQQTAGRPEKRSN